MAALHLGLHRLLALPMRGLRAGSAGLGGTQAREARPAEATPMDEPGPRPGALWVV